jgi:hypothetical protein
MIFADMSLYFGKMSTVKVQKLVTTKALQMEMAVAGAVTDILIAGAFTLFENIFSDDIITAELFKMAVDSSFTHILSAERRRYFIGCQVTIGIFFKIFQHYFALLCFICHIPFLSQNETEFHFHITVLLYSFKTKKSRED